LEEGIQLDLIERDFYYLGGHDFLNPFYLREEIEGVKGDKGELEST